MNNKIKTYGKWFFFSFVWLFVLAFLIDLMTKLLCQNYIPLEDKIYLIPNFLYVTLTYNTGMAWGLFGGEVGHIILTVVSWLASAIIIAFYVWKYKKLNKFYKAMLALILAGTMGNMIDRTFYELGVIDWIGFQFGDYFFPVFNLADAYLVVGIIIIVIYLIVIEIKDYMEKAKEKKDLEASNPSSRKEIRRVYTSDEIEKMSKQLEEEKKVTKNLDLKEEDNSGKDSSK